MKRAIVFALVSCVVAAAPLATWAQALNLPPGFTATLVAEGLTNARHLAVRGDDVYVSTNSTAAQPGPRGIWAVHMGPDHKAAQVAHFGDVFGGTGIAIHDGALYASSDTTVWRYALGAELVPAAQPTAIVVGMPKEDNRNRILAFDDRGRLFVELGGVGNNVCTVGGGGGKVGMKPCPDLADRAGVWRFSATQPGQEFAKAEQWATGIRNMTAFRWSAKYKGLYGILHERDSSSRTWPEYFTQAQDTDVGDALYRIDRGVDLGWPYSYWDGGRKQRFVAPEYGGDGKQLAPKGKTVAPVLSLITERDRAAPVDMVFYDAKQFPAPWRGGVFISRHGGAGPPRPGGYEGYDIVFVPMDAQGRAGKMVPFATGFAGPTPDDRVVARAAARPNGLAVTADGALLVVDSKNGKLWRISYARP